MRVGPARLRSRLDRAVGAIAASALAAGVVVAGGVGPAQAAPPLGEGLYGTAGSSSNTIYLVDRSTGVATSALTVPAAQRPTGSGNLNQVGLSNDGGTMILTDALSVLEYTAASESWTRVLRSSGPAVDARMGGVDPTTGRLYFGGERAGSAGVFRFTSYDPATNQIAAASFDVTAQNPTGSNGDLAFDRQGNMYFVTGGTTSAQVYRVNGSDLGKPSVTASPVGGQIPSGLSITSMAFGTDGFIYIGGGNIFRRVNPITGAPGAVATAQGVSGLTDFGSRALPATGTVTVPLEDRFKPSDEFGYEIEGNGLSTGTTGVTDGDKPAEIGPLLLVPSETPYTVTQEPEPGTNPANYTTTWQCIDTADDSVVSEGEGTTASFIMPISRPDITCSFTNVPLTAPQAPDDVVSAGLIGSPVTADVLAKATGDGLDPADVRIIDADGDPVTELVVEGEGTWTVDPETGEITFTPEEGFEGNPTPITYEVVDERGNPERGTITVNYAPEALDDASRGNEQRSTVLVEVLMNDRGAIAPDTVRILDGESPVTELVVEGQGTWRVDTGTGVVSFEPAEGFSGNPAPVTYQVTGAGGDVSEADVVVTFSPAAADDTSASNEQGATVVVDVLDNDLGALLPGSVRIVDGDDLATELVVEGQGTWSVDAESGAISFEPAEGFSGTPSPITYQVADELDETSRARVTVTYSPLAADDDSRSNAQGSTVVVDVLDNDLGALDAGTVRIVAGEELVGELVVEGQGTWRVDSDTGAVSFEPAEGFSANPSPITYRVSDELGETSRARVTVSYVPLAANDVSLGNEQGTTVVVDVLDNDLGTLDPGTVRIVAGDDLVSELVVEGQGTWRVDPDTGAVSFEPAEGFSGNPSPITYRVADELDETSRARVTVTYSPVAADDESLGNAQGATVVVDVLANDLGALDPTTVRIVDGEELVGELVVEGQGTWSVDAESGAISFEPAEGFSGNPSPITYQVRDVRDEVSGAAVTVSYAPAAVDDESSGNTLGEPVVVDVLDNDLGALDASSVRIVAGEELVRELVVEGQGTWSVDAETGALTFSPQEDYEGDPAPVTYQVADARGETSEATVTVTYSPVAVDDESLGNAQGSKAEVDVLANDRGDLDPGSVRIVAGEDLVGELVVEGQGTWSVDADDGAISFEPAEGFSGNPSPITYRVTHAGRTTATAQVTVTFVPQAVDDESSDNPLGEPAVVDVLANDLGALDPGTVRIVAGEELVGELVVEGQGTWSVDAGSGALTFTPQEGFEGDPSPIAYEVADDLGETSEAIVTVTYSPVATDDESVGNAQGSTAVVDVLANDRGDLDPASVRIVAGEDLVGELVVEGQGTWRVDSDTGAVSFEPTEGFSANPSPVTYRATHAGRTTVTAQVTVVYLPQAVDDESRGHQVGTPVSVDVLANDRGALDPGTVRIVAGDDLVSELVVDGQGTWTVHPQGAAITFVPVAGFTGDPDPITYQVGDVEANITRATVTIDYDQPAAEPGDGGTAVDGGGDSEGVLGLLPGAGGPALWLLLLGALVSAVGAGVVLSARRRAQA